jgi:membrane protein
MGKTVEAEEKERPAQAGRSSGMEMRLRAKLNAFAAGFAQHPLALWITRTVRGFSRDSCLLRAAALTYATLLALVPLLAVVLALLKGAGFESHLRPFLLNRFPVLEPEAVDQLLAYISRANAQAVGGIGLLALLIFSWFMLSVIEEALNHVFGINRARSYVRRTGEYLSMIVVGTVLVVLSILLQTVLGSPTLIQHFLGDQVASGATRLGLTLLPWVSVWLGMTFLFSWMPNTRVPLRPAFLGGLIGGTLFQLVQLGYIELQFGFARYHAIYGALAQLPILLVWVFLSWTVVLIGAEAAAARRSLGVREDSVFPAVPRAAPRPELLALLVLRDVGDAFRAGNRTPRADEIAARLGISVHAVREAVEPLQRAGILIEPEGEHGYLPAAALSALSLEQVLSALSRGGSGPRTR